MKIHLPFGDHNEHVRRFHESPDAGHQSLEAVLARAAGKIIKWLTVVAAIWSYRAWEPFFVRGMGRMYWGTRQFLAGLFCLLVFPYWFVAVFPTALMILFFVPGLNLIAYPVSKILPDGPAFLGLKDRAAEATAAYNGEEAGQTASAAIPSLAEVVRRNMDAGTVHTANQAGAEALKFVFCVFPRSLVEAMWLLLKWDFVAYCLLILAFLFFSRRHFKATRLVQNTGFEGRPIRPLLPRLSAGKWTIRQTKVPVPVMLAFVGVIAIPLGFSLCGAFALVGALSYTFFRGRMADRKSRELHASLASEAASKQTEKEKKELQTKLAEEAEAMRREIEAKEARRAERAAAKGDGAGASLPLKSAGGVEIARPVYSDRPRKAAAKAPVGYLPRMIRNFAESENPVDRELAQLLTEASEREKSFR